jgi:hypothetical protein
MQTLNFAAAKAQRELEKSANLLERATEARSQQEAIIGWHREWGLDAVPLRVIGFEKEEAR